LRITWALRHPGDRIGMFNSCISDRAVVFWPCTKKLRPSRAVEHEFRPAQSPTRWAQRMLTSSDITNRKPVWKALSEFYLDNQLDDEEIEQVSRVIFESPYSIEEVKRINKYEIFPILQWNLLSIAGEWDYFDENWLVARITNRLDNQSWYSILLVDLSYPLFKWMTANNWSKVEKMYVQISNTTEI